MSFLSGSIFMATQGKIMKYKKTINDCLLAAILVAAFSFQISGKAEETNKVTKHPDTNNIAVPELSRFSDGHHSVGKADTNGLFCEIWVQNSPRNKGQQPPVCEVSVKNTTANSFRNCWKTSPTNFLRIDLLDSLGKPVKKTIAGKTYEAVLDLNQLKDAFSSKRPNRLAKIDPSGTHFASFSIPELFELKETGEYTLRVNMRLIQVWPEFKTIWLPEVTAKIQLRSGDLSK